MVEAALMMVAALAASVALWKLIAPALAHRTQAEPMRIRTDEARRRK
jgi:hypothetical protein